VTGVSLELRRVTVAFNRGTPNEVCALRALSLEAAPGEFIVLIGGNGSGKSTLLRAVAGTVEPEAGTVRIGGNDVTRQPDFRRARNIGFVHQDPILGTCPNLTLHENFVLSHAARSWWWPLPYVMTLPRKQLSFVDAVGLGLDQRLAIALSNFSGGQRQAIAVAIVFSRGAPLVLLDEYLSALDETTADRVLDFTVQLAHEQSPTVMLVIHDIERALRIKKRTVVLNNGEIVRDIPADQIHQIHRDDLLALLGRFGPVSQMVHAG
jgi:putative ABC transport system ATP-binding protein